MRRASRHFRHNGRADALIHAAVEAAQKVYVLGRRWEMAAARNIALPTGSEKAKTVAAMKAAYAGTNALRRLAETMGLDNETRTLTDRELALRTAIYNALTTANAAGDAARLFGSGMYADGRYELRTLGRRLEGLGVDVPALDRRAATSLEGAAHLTLRSNFRRRTSRRR